MSVAQTAGFTEDAYYERAKQVLGSDFWSNWDPTDENFGQPSFIDLFNEQLEKTISNKNIVESYPYINEKGQLCLIAKKYSLAAADFYWQDLNMSDFELSPYYESVAEKITHAINLTEDEAYQIACDYWNFKEGSVDEETGFQLFLIYDGLTEESDGNNYYVFRLRWWVTERSALSTIDSLYINAETGECSYSI